MKRRIEDLKVGTIIEVANSNLNFGNDNYFIVDSEFNFISLRDGYTSGPFLNDLIENGGFKEIAIAPDKYVSMLESEDTETSYLGLNMCKRMINEV